MQVYILDKDFQTIGAIKVFNSLIWTRRYYEPGVFEFHTSSSFFPLFNSGKYICRNDRSELGVIREVNYAQTDKGERSAYCKGYFAEKLLDDRVLQAPVNISGTPEEIALALVDGTAIHPANSGRVIPRLVLGSRKGLGTRIPLQTTGDKLGEKLYETEQTQELSHRILYDYERNTLTFECWKGLNRTENQEENSPAIFSNRFYNVKSAIYGRDESSYANVAYVAGEGEGNARTIVEVDIRTDSAEERREIYVDARDLQSEYQDAGGAKRTYDSAQYRAILRQRGLEKLSEYSKIETVHSDIDAGANLVYMKDFDLGDLCTYQNMDVGIECDERITAIQEVYEGAKMTLNVTFGTDEATTITKIIKREAN